MNYLREVKKTIKTAGGKKFKWWFLLTEQRCLLQNILGAWLMNQGYPLVRYQILCSPLIMDVIAYDPLIKKSCSIKLVLSEKERNFVHDSLSSNPELAHICTKNFFATSGLWLDLESISYDGHGILLVFPNIADEDKTPPVTETIMFGRAEWVLSLKRDSSETDIPLINNSVLTPYLTLRRSFLHRKKGKEPNLFDDDEDFV